MIFLALTACGSDDSVEVGDGDPIGLDDCPAGYNQVIGNESDDTLIGTEGSDCLLGFGGDDVIEGLGGDDFLWGGAGSDSIKGGDGDDEIYSGSGVNDIVQAGRGDDDVTVCCDGGFVDAGGGADQVSGDPEECGFDVMGSRGLIIVSDLSPSGPLGSIR